MTYRSFFRCPTYTNYPSSCVLRTDPNDNCCLVPDCNSFVTPTPGTGLSGTNPSITFNPGVYPTTSGSNPGTQVIVYPTSIPGTFTGTSGYFPSGTGTQTGPSGRTSNLFINLFRCSEPELFMHVSRPVGVQLVIFVCSNIPVVLFETSEISKCLNTLFLLSPNFCFIKGITCDLFIARNDSCMG